MNFKSTTDTKGRVSFSAALLGGLADDGGLYVPCKWPQFSPEDFPLDLSLPTVAETLIAPFAVDDPLGLHLSDIVRDAFNFPAPLQSVAGQALSVLELFHGPTAAFKDFGARFLAACFERLIKPSDPPVHILVATSGDTGGAVAAAFHKRPNISVSILYPQGLVSPTQERQLTCWGDNVRSFSVLGTFDDCQRIVKSAFLDSAFKKEHGLVSANSINLGRLLPQAVYYAAASLAQWRTQGEKLNVIIPSGNLGNAVACIWARHMGLPIGEVVLAHNTNRSVLDYLQCGEWKPRTSLATLASAMDVGNPSNMERLRFLFPVLGDLRSAVTAFSVNDTEIRNRICHDYKRYGQVWCPHTAVAAEIWARMPPMQRKDKPWCLIATASPAKFPEIVEPLIGRAVTVPIALSALLSRSVQFEVLNPSLSALRNVLAEVN